MKKAPGMRGGAAGGAGIRTRRRAVSDRNSDLSRALSRGRGGAAVPRAFAVGRPSV
ncbi:hypothetical protein P186_0889 [Pyrobaculum ferrireducens]|uniref:Uncharacterized protein n=1 Tax=Pyrobaculum ferrireducens TaxID=1104324 RepID=G7VB20_9CREN|nr:hypothetical protein P186_0889 [Pyrobaculum ferrireducens]